MKTNDNGKDVQGTEIAKDGQIEIKVDKLEKAPEAKKKQATSISYTLTAFGENIRKLKEAELIEEEWAGKLDELREEIAMKWVKKKMGM